MTSTLSLPARVAWTVDQLAVVGADRVLEVGGGRGVAAAVICARLTGGSFLGIDRSETAVRASAERNREYVERSVARFEHQALEDLDPARLPSFDKVFAINVNLFWTRPAHRELDLVRRLLRGDGRLQLTFETPGAAGVSRIADRLSAQLDTADYASTSATVAFGRTIVLGLSCRPR